MFGLYKRYEASIEISHPVLPALAHVGQEHRVATSEQPRNVSLITRERNILLQVGVLPNDRINRVTQ